MRPTKTFYESGQLESEGYTDEKGKTGSWRYYDENGNIFKEVTFKDDVENGKLTIYENGNVISRGEYVIGELSGSWFEFYENGLKKEVGVYTKGEYKVIHFWNNQGKQTLKDGTGKKVEVFGSGIDIFVQYFENGDFVKEERITSNDYERHWSPPR